MLFGNRSRLVGDDGDIAEVRKSRDNALAENLKMKKEIEKLNYRIRHLLKEMVVLEETPSL